MTVDEDDVFDIMWPDYVYITDVSDEFGMYHYMVLQGNGKCFRCMKLMLMNRRKQYIITLGIMVMILKISIIFINGLIIKLVEAIMILVLYLM